MTNVEYSKRNPDATLNIAGRTRKAEMTLAVLKDYLGTSTDHWTVLDAAASGGIIADFLAGHVRHVIGIDIDRHAIRFAHYRFKRDNLHFLIADSTRIPFSDNLFDVVLCAHLYEHVTTPALLMKEIFRVLRPGGVCYFAAGNRLNFIEPHYSLPFLSLLPKSLAHYYLRFTGLGHYYAETHLSLWGLRALVKDFEIIDYSQEIVNHPARYQAASMLRPHSFKAMLARFVCRHIYWLMPGYIWILRK